MQLPRFVGLVDLGVATIVLVAVVLPAREMYADPAVKGTDAARFALAFAEACTVAHPDDGAIVDDLARRLGTAGFKDWAIEAAVHGAERAKQSPSEWRALLAASVAYVDKREVIPALDFANRALSACEAQIQADGQCPSWEQIRMKLYQQHLDAGVKSGIDPHTNPVGFRRAGESALRSIHIGGSRETERGSGTGSGSAPVPAPAP